MKYTSLIFYFLIFYFSCNINHKATNESKTIQKIPFSLDSLDNINFFDFYGKTLEELLENNIVNQNTGYSSNIFIQGHFGYLGLYYHDTSDYSKSRFLKVGFEELKYTNEDTLNSNVSISLAQLFKEKIRRIDNKIYQITKDIEEERRFIDSFKNINLEEYHGKSIDELISLPIFKKWSWLIFRDTKIDNKLCLDDLVFMYLFKEKRVLLRIIPKSFDYSDKCIEDILNRHWNLNDLRKETIKEVEFIGL